MTTSRPPIHDAAERSLFGRERELARIYELVDGAH
jgi:hypothetical protein